MRRIFSTVFGPHEPALTAGSLAISATGRPPTVPIPVTTPSAPSPSCSQLASSPSSANESASRRRATRSRTGSFSCSATFLRCRSAPPSSAASRAALTLLTTAPGRSGPSLLLGLGINDPRLLGARLLFGTLVFLRVLGARVFLRLLGAGFLLIVVGREARLLLVSHRFRLLLARGRIELCGPLQRIGSAVLRNGAGQLRRELLGVGEDVVT